MNEVALVQKERDDQLLMAENEKQEALHAAANEKGALLDRLNKTQGEVENAQVEIDRIKREAFSRAEQDKVLYCITSHQTTEQQFAHKSFLKLLPNPAGIAMFFSWNSHAF